MLANLRVRGFVLIEIDKKTGMILMFVVHYPFLLFRILPKFLMKMSHETFRSRDVKIMPFLFYSMCNLLDIDLNSELYFVSFAFRIHNETEICSKNEVRLKRIWEKK